MQEKSQEKSFCGKITSVKFIPAMINFRTVLITSIKASNNLH